MLQDSALSAAASCKTHTNAGSWSLRRFRSLHACSAAQLTLAPLNGTACAMAVSDALSHPTGTSRKFPPVDHERSSNQMTLLELAHQAHLVLFGDHDSHLALQSTQSTSTCKRDGTACSARSRGVEPTICLSLDSALLSSTSNSNSSSFNMASSSKSTFDLLQSTHWKTRCHCPYS